MTPRITVRCIQESDIDKLVGALAPEVTSARIKRRFQEDIDGFREMFVAETNGDVAGSVSTSHHRLQLPNSLRMFALEVGLAFRRQGVGTALIGAIEEKARLQGLARVNLEVALDNNVAQRLYEKLGYRVIGEPVINRWEKTLEDGKTEQIEEPSWIMLKYLGPKGTS